MNSVENKCGSKRVSPLSLAFDILNDFDNIYLYNFFLSISGTNSISGALREVNNVVENTKKCTTNEMNVDI